MLNYEYTINTDILQIILNFAIEFMTSAYEERY